MCRRKPGRRCPKHCLAELDDARRLLNAVAADPDVDPADADAARDRWRLRQYDYLSTGQVREENAAAITAMSSGPLTPEMRETLSDLRRDLIIGEALAQERKRHLAMMPALPADPDARAHHHELGGARDDMAKYAIQIETARREGDLDRAARFEQAHRDAADRALDAEAWLRMFLAHGEANQAHMTRADQHRYRRSDDLTRGALAYRSHRDAALDAHPGGFDSPRSELPEQHQPAVPGETSEDLAERAAQKLADSDTGREDRLGYRRKPTPPTDKVGKKWANMRKQSQRLRGTLAALLATADRAAQPTGTGGGRGSSDDSTNPATPADPTGILLLLDLLAMPVEAARRAS